MCARKTGLPAEKKRRDGKKGTVWCVVGEKRPANGSISIVYHKYNECASWPHTLHQMLQLQHSTYPVWQAEACSEMRGWISKGGNGNAVLGP